MTLTKLILISIVVLMGFSCSVHPIAEGHFYVQNNSDLVLKIKANSSNQQIQLLDSIVSQDVKELIFIYREGSGGNVLPSNVFTTFKIYAVSTTLDSLIYEGVRNEDWIESNPGSLRYTLTVSN